MCCTVCSLCCAVLCSGLLQLDRLTGNLVACSKAQAFDVSSTLKCVLLNNLADCSCSARSCPEDVKDYLERCKDSG